MNVGKRIKERRKKLGLTADDVASALNKDRSTIYRYESSDIEKLPTTILEPLAKVLKTTPAYLMGWEEFSTTTNYEDYGLRPIQKKKFPMLGEIAVVVIDDEATLKRVYKYPNRLELRPENPTYKVLNYEGEQLNHICILGKAVTFMSVVR